jgi:hypothetical protein
MLKPIHELLSNEWLSNEILSMFLSSKRQFIDWDYYRIGETRPFIEMSQQGGGAGGGSPLKTHYLVAHL